ncbi:MAG: lysophospholipid acyltransferase family protein [Planctomycetota bacterium]
MGGWLAPVFLPFLLRTLSRTWKLKLENEERLDRHDPTQGTLYAIWHGRMLLAMPRHPGTEYTILVSMSADGGLAKDALEWFGYQIIRGSSSRGGASAMRAMLRELRKGGRVVVTPDGPRGPRHAVNPGLAWLSRASRMPLVPVGMIADRAWHLRSWDACTIPKPFARVGIVYGDPIEIGDGGGDEPLELATAELRRRLITLEHRAAALIGTRPDWSPNQE